MPDDERDLNLARQIGKLREGGSRGEDEPQAVGEEDQAFYQELRAMKQHALEKREAFSPESSKRLWNRIDDATKSEVRARPSDRPPVRGDFRKVRSRRWRLVASVAGALMVGLAAVVLFRSPEVDLVASSESGVVEYVADDGSVVTLRPHSRLYLLEKTRNVSSYRLIGEGYFDVSPQGSGSFSVEGGDTRVTVIGTRFNLSTWGRRGRVYLEEGQIRFEHVYSGSSVLLAPGQRSESTVNGILEPVDDTGHEHLDWMSGEMLFEGQPVSLVLAELEQHFGVTFTGAEAPEDDTISGRILLGDEKQSLDDLGLVMGGRFVATAPGSYRFTAN